MLRRVQRSREEKGCHCLGCSENFTTRTRTNTRNLQEQLLSLQKQVQFMRNKNRKRYSRKCVGKVDKKRTQKQTKIISHKLKAASCVKRHIGNKTMSSTKTEKIDTMHTENKSVFSEKNSCDSDLSLQIGTVFSLAPNTSESDKSVILPEKMVSLPSSNAVVKDRNERVDFQNDISGLTVPSVIKSNMPIGQKPQFFLLPLGGKNVLIPVGKLSGKPKAYVFDSRLPLEYVTKNICPSVSSTIIKEEFPAITSSGTGRTTTTSVSFPSAHSPSMIASAHKRNCSPSWPVSEVDGEKSSDSECFLGTHQRYESPSHNATQNSPVLTNCEERINKLKEKLRLQHKAVQRFSKDSAFHQSCV